MGSVTVTVSRLRRDIALNTVLALANTLTYMWVIREASSLLVPAALGLLLLAKRLADSISNLLQLGSAQTVRRYVSMASDASTKYKYVVVNLVIFAISSTVFIGIFLFDLSGWANIIFPGQVLAERITVALMLLCISTVLGFIASSTLLALGYIKTMNAVEITNGSGWLLLVLWSQGNAATIDQLLLIQAAGTTLISGGALLLILRALSEASRGSRKFAEYRQIIKETFAYGIPRTLTPFLDASLVLLGPWFLRADPTDAGYMIIAFTFLRLGRMLVQPAALVMGVSVAAHLGLGQSADLRRRLSIFFGTVAYTSVFIVTAIFPWIPLALYLWLGNGGVAEQVVPYAVALFLAMPPLAIMQGLKEPIEMIWRRPLYLVNLLICLLALFIWFGATNRILGAPASVLSGYIVVYWIGCLVCIWWLRGYLGTARYYINVQTMILLSMVFLANLLASVLSAQAGLAWQALLAFVVVASSAVACVFYAYRTSAILFLVDMRQALAER